MFAVIISRHLKHTTFKIKHFIVHLFLTFKPQKEGIDN